MNPVNNDEKKRRERRIELANNLTLAAVVITAIINTVAVILKIVWLSRLKRPKQQLQKSPMLGVP